MMMSDRTAIFVFSAETVAVFLVARHFGASFVVACRWTMVVNTAITVFYLILLGRNLREIERNTRRRWP